MSLPLRTSILRRVVTQTLILTAFVIVLLTTLSFLVSRETLERSVQSQLLAVVSLAEDSLETSLQASRQRVSLLASHGDIERVLRRGAGADDIERLLLQLQRDESSIRGIIVFAANGQRIASAGEMTELPASALKSPFHQPVLGQTGWERYDVFTPVWVQGGERIGYVALRYDTRSILRPVLAVTAQGGDAREALFVLERDGEVQLIHPSPNTDASYMLSLGKASDALPLPLTQSLKGQEGVVRGENYRGRDAIMAYRYLPTLGWGFVLEVDRTEALSAIRRLALTHALLGALLLAFSAILALLLGRQLTNPLRNLTAKVERLGPGRWTMRRTIQTGDEVGMLEQVIVQLAGRLQRLYEYQEGEIEERTQELRKQYALDRAILEHIGYGIMTVDRTGVVTHANPAAQEMLGQEETQLLRKPVGEAMPLCGHRGNPLEGDHPVKQCIRTKSIKRSTASVHVSIRRTDGSFLPIMFVASPLVEGNKLFGGIIVFQDISEERRLDYLKSEFVSLASHQLRTPLSTIRWYVELLGERKQSLSDDQRSYLSEMERAVQRMVTLLTTLLHAAQLEGENIRPDIRDVDVAVLVAELHGDCRTLAKQAGLTCALAVPKHPVHVETDPILLRIVMQNLVSNAVKYSGGGKKRITIEVEVKQSVVLLHVHDEGVGIPKNEQRRIFQRFFRASNVRRLDTDGNGLGLYISQSIVERLGGKISFKSVENSGTVFTVTLPKKRKRAGGKKDQ